MKAESEAERSYYWLQNIYSMLETTEKTGNKKHNLKMRNSECVCVRARARAHACVHVG